jgi:hypothetical protein
MNGDGPVTLPRARGLRRRSVLAVLLALAAPLLALVALLVLLQRQGLDRLQAVPALAIGTGLAISGRLGRARHRRAVLRALGRPSSSRG